MNGQVVYAFSVLADGLGCAAGCEQSGHTVRFDVQGYPMAPVVKWSTGGLWELPLGSVHRNYLPLIVNRWQWLQ